MGLNGVARHVQALGDLGGGEPVGGELGDLALARRQRCYSTPSRAPRAEAEAVELLSGFALERRRAHVRRQLERGVQGLPGGSPPGATPQRAPETE
jgi:hypothetical protein